MYFRIVETVQHKQTNKMKNIIAYMDANKELFTEMGFTRAEIIETVSNPLTVSSIENLFLDCIWSDTECKANFKPVNEDIDSVEWGYIVGECNSVIVGLFSVILPSIPLVEYPLD